MATNMTGAEFAAEWSNRLSGSVEKIKRGVNAVNEAPSARAVRQQQKLLSNFTASVTSGKWAANTSKVTLEDWRSAMLNKGVNRIATGANEAVSKVAEFGQRLLTYQNAQLPTVQKMPSTNLAETKARMNAWFDIMSKFKNT